MKNYNNILEKCLLFEGIAPSELESMLSCLKAQLINVPKNGFIFREGDRADRLGIVLSGSVSIVREDYYGNRSILTKVQPGEMFGESFACAGVEKFPISALAEEDSFVLIIGSAGVFTCCSNACPFHNRMIHNMLKVLAGKNLVLNQKIEICSKRTTREKLMAYLLSQAKKNQSDSFTIPFDRQALADYLEVERSAMSAEISKLRKDGIIECERSHFRLLKKVGS